MSDYEFIPELVPGLHRLEDIEQFPNLTFGGSRNDADVINPPAQNPHAYNDQFRR